MKRLVWLIVLVGSISFGQPAGTGFCYYAAGNMWIRIHATLGGQTIQAWPPNAIRIFGDNSGVPTAIQCNANGDISAGAIFGVAISAFPTSGTTYALTYNYQDGTISWISGGGSTTTATAIQTLSADPSTWTAGTSFLNTTTKIFKVALADGSSVANNTINGFINTSNIYGLNTAAPKNFRGLSASIQQGSGGLIVMGYCCDSLNARAASSNRDTYNMWEIQKLQAYLGNAGPGWVSFVGDNTGNLNKAPVGVTTTLSPVATSANWIYTVEGLTRNGSGGALSTASRTGWGPDTGDITCATGISCSITVTCASCTEIIGFIYKQTGGTNVTATSDIGVVSGSPFNTNGANATPVYVDSGVGSIGSHSLVLSGTGPWTASGSDVIAGTSGVKSERIAMGGAQFCDFNAEQTATGQLINQWQKLGINVMHLMASTNEILRATANYQCPAQVTTGRTITQFFGDLSTLATSVHGMTTDPDITVSPDPDGYYMDGIAAGQKICGSTSDQTCNPVAPYAQAVVDFAEANPTIVELINAYQLSNNWSALCTGITTGGPCPNTKTNVGYYTDNVHWNLNGEQMYVNSRLSYLNLSMLNPQSANLLASDVNGNSTPALLSSGDIYIGQATGLPVDHAVSQDVALASTGVATVNGLKTVPFCAGYSPVNGQVVQYTTGGTPNPCYAPATVSGSGVQSVALQNNGTPYGTMASGQNGTLNFANCTVSGSAPSFTITCSTATNSPGGSTNGIQYNADGSTFGGTAVPTATDPQVAWQVAGSAPKTMRPIAGPSAMWSNPKLITLGFGISPPAANTPTDMPLGVGEVNAGNIYIVPASRKACVVSVGGYDASTSVLITYDDDGATKVPLLYSATSVTLGGVLGYCLTTGHRLAVNVVSNNTGNVWAQVIEDDVTGSVVSAILPGGSSGTQTLYTVPASTHVFPMNTYMSVITSGAGGVPTITCANTSGGAITVTPYFVPTGGTAGTTNQIAAGTSIGNNASLGIVFNAANLAGLGTVQLNYSSAGTAGTFGCHATFMTDTGTH